MKYIPGFEGLYFITEQGRVFSHGRISTGRAGKSRTIHPKWLAPRFDKDGYITAALTDSSGVQRYVKIHQIVLQLYGPPRPSSAHIPNHINFNKADNDINNLEWKTTQENVQHAIENGRHYTPFINYKGESHLKAKLDNAAVLYIRSVYKPNSPKNGATALAAYYGVSPSTISGIANYKTWRHI